MIILQSKETKEKVIVIDQYTTKHGNRAFILANMENGYIYPMLTESIPDNYDFLATDGTRRAI